MIIRRLGDELVLIRQPDHAALAADLMEHWRLGGLPDHPRRAAILAATRHHDDGWQEEDAHLHIGEGGDPLDFIAVPPRVKHRIWPRAAARLSAISPYVAALVAQHALTIHAALRQDPAWRQFFRQMERARDDHLANALPDEAAAVLDDYQFVQTGDHLSLTFCNAWTAPLSGHGYRAILKGITLEVTPDPFAGCRIPLQIRGRSILARAYRSTADLRQACAAAPVLLLEGEAAGA